MRSTTTRTVRRSATVVAAAGAALAISAGAASAHDCFIPMYNLNGPQSANWEPITAEFAANNFAGFPTPCAGAAKAGYAALKAAGLPVGIKIYVGSNANEEHMTIGSGSANPNLADGKGLENFQLMSPVPDQMLGTWISAAAQYTC
jgi:hypothetical protein